ncbi:MAG: cytidylyltransferase domain-containing protein [Methanosarcina sp.]
MSSDIIAIIPARGGSKGIPRKNIKLLAGKPLIAYTIEEALKSKYLNQVVVSTEDEEIENISKRYGAEVIRRPSSLARDDSPTIDSVLHAFEALDIKKEKTYIIVLLQPTSPLRTFEDIDNAIKLFLNKKCESVISVCEYGHSPYWAYKVEEEYLKPVFGNTYLKMRRQDLPKCYMPNGAIYISTVDFLKDFKNFSHLKTYPYLMPFIRSIDIDSDIDFIFAEAILNSLISESNF